MKRVITSADMAHFYDALDFFVGKTQKRIAEEAKLHPGVVNRLLRFCVTADSVERKGNLFRIKNAAPWRRA